MSYFRKKSFNEVINYFSANQLVQKKKLTKKGGKNIFIKQISKNYNVTKGQKRL